MWAAKVPLLFRLYAGKDNFRQRLSRIQNMSISRLIDEIDDTIGCVFLRRSTSDEIDHRVDPGTFSKKWKNVTVVEWFWGGAIQQYLRDGACSAF